MPVLNASLTDCVFEVERSTTAQEVNQAFREAAQGPLQGILGYEERPLVSVDYKGDPRSSIVDGPLTTVVDGTCVKVLAWYDNETGYVHRMLDMARTIGRLLPLMNLRHYVVVTAAYWAFTLTDGALRLLVLLHFHRLGYTPIQLASLFLSTSSSASSPTFWVAGSRRARACAPLSSAAWRSRSRRSACWRLSTLRGRGRGRSDM